MSTRYSPNGRTRRVVRRKRPLCPGHKILYKHICSEGIRSMAAAVTDIPVVSDVPAAQVQTRVASLMSTVSSNYLPFSHASEPIDWPAACALITGMLAAAMVIQVLRAFWKWTCIRFCPCCGVSIDNESLISTGSKLSDGRDKGRPPPAGAGRGAATRSPPRSPPPRSNLKR